MDNILEKAQGIFPALFCAKAEEEKISPKPLTKGAQSVIMSCNFLEFQEKSGNKKEIEK